MTGRPLVCTVCGDTVVVYEIPREFIETSRYRCGDCDGVNARAQLELLARRQERKEYDPSQAAIPF